MKNPFAIILLFLALLTPRNVDAQINTDQVLQIGRNALYFEDYVVAIQYFNQVIAAKPHLAQPYLYRAIAKLSLDDLRGAEEDASLAIERNPFLTDAYEIRGVARQNQGKHGEALEDYDKSLEMLPMNRVLLFHKANAEELTDNFEGAKETYGKLISAYPKFDGAYFGRARLNMENGDTIAAIGDLTQAIELNPNSTNSYILRANLRMLKEEDYNGALADIDNAIKRLPKQAGLYVNRAYIRYKLDDYAGAMADYDLAIELEPLNTIALFNRSLLRMEVRDFNNAEADLNRILSLKPRDYRALYNRAIVYRELHDYKASLRDINKLIEAFPDLSAAYLIRFDVKQLMGDHTAQRDLDKSIELGRKRIKHDGSNPSMVEFLATSDPTGSSGNDDTESQEYVAAQFSQLINVAAETNIEQEFNNKSIRGRVQDRNISIDPEPIFIVTYYSIPTELKPSGEYMKQIGEVNKTHALNYMLQVTNREYALTDSVEISRHFQSIEYYNSYLATHNPRAIDYFGRGMNRMTVHDYAAAARDFSLAMQISPDFSLAKFMEAVAKLRNLDATGARESMMSESVQMHQAQLLGIINDFESALSITPDMPLAWYNIGCIYIRLHNYPAALDAFTKAIELNKDFGEAYFNRGYVNLTLGNKVAGLNDLSTSGQLGVAPAYNLMKRISN